jgi:hypothetical protein
VGTTDIVPIIRHYRGKRFGFASRNFYPEFLAALQVEKDYQAHFGPLRMETPLAHEKFRIDCPIPLRTAARFANTDEDELLLLNPALGSLVRNGRAPVPRGYHLRIPVGTVSAFSGRYDPWQIKEKERLAALEKARKARLAARKPTRGKKRTVAKSRKRTQVREAEAADSKSKKRRG